jgi:NAD(P)-dependent dehydrogenase (short-subunit alcohol dehydrogenase family)
MKTVVITGSTRGIGLAMAQEFLRNGCNVVLSGRHEVLPDAAKQVLAGNLDHILYVQCDVSRSEGVQRLWDEAAARWGQVDIWINNAGQNAPHKVIWDTDTAHVDRLIGTNVCGMIYGSQTAAKNMIAQGGGQIWSMEGLGSNDMIQEKTILYGMSKRALTYFMRGLAKELAHTPVKAGRLSPGMMLTDFITKAPDGNESPVLQDEQFRKIFNILADRPEKVAAFFVPRMLANTKNDAHLVYLTGMKAMARFMTAPMRKRRLI